MVVEIPDDRALLLESTEITFSDEDMEVGYGSRITRPQEALLLESSEITFSNEDMEVGYPDHRRPLYLAASINQIPIKKALVNIGASVNLIPLSTLQAVGISERKIQGCPMEVTGFGGRGEYIADHIQLWLKVGPMASLAQFQVVKIEVSYHVLLGRP